MQCNSIFPFGDYNLVTAMNGSTLYSALTHGMGSDDGNAAYYPELVSLPWCTWDGSSVVPMLRVLEANDPSIC